MRWHAPGCVYLMTSIDGNHIATALSSQYFPTIRGYNAMLCPHKFHHKILLDAPLYCIALQLTGRWVNIPRGWILSEHCIPGAASPYHWYAEGLQYAGLKVQVKHFDRLFRVYIKSIGRDTVCRVEESLNPKKKTAVQAINEIFPNPNDRRQRHQYSVDNSIKISEIHDMVKNLVDLYEHSRSAIIGHDLVEGGGS